jgi:hypothetical protein
MKHHLIVCLLGAAALQTITNWTVHLRHAGPMQIGMTLEEARRIVNDPNAKLATPGDNVEECGFLQSQTLPDGLELMFSRGRLVRIDVRKHGILTASGAGVGDTEARIQNLYPGHIQVTPHHYDSDGHYLIYKPQDAADQGFELLFETSHGKVTSFRIGFREPVSWVEGCL